MCKTCEGTGRVVIEHGWGLQFHPCPSTNCDFEVDDSDMDRLEQRMLKASESA